jgi:hypothetical protein
MVLVSIIVDIDGTDVLVLCIIDVDASVARGDVLEFVVVVLGGKLGDDTIGTVVDETDDDKSIEDCVALFVVDFIARVVDDKPDDDGEIEVIVDDGSIEAA